MWGNKRDFTAGAVDAFLSNVREFKNRFAIKFDKHKLDSLGLRDIVSTALNQARNYTDFSSMSIIIIKFMQSYTIRTTISKSTFVFRFLAPN